MSSILIKLGTRRFNLNSQFPHFVFNGIHLDLLFGVLCLVKGGSFIRIYGSVFMRKVQVNIFILLSNRKPSAPLAKLDFKRRGSGSK